MTVNDMSHQLSLPLATCYKLVEQMVELGLMARVGTTRTSSRGRAANYTSSLKSVTLKMVDLSIEATVTWKNGQMESFRRGFQNGGTGPEAMINDQRVTFSRASQL
jgi:predicted transcriptional regulator